ncbi:MAG TPA: WD40 repeat domain-containing protein, partial [Gemmataceae bacterium]|nr:WD40 repeat domain-containing protein [Gemmataceae bacterium]
SSVNQSFVREIRTGKQRLLPRILTGPTAITPDGRTIAVADGTWPGAVAIWDLATARMVRQLRGSRSGLAFSPDGQMLATGGVDDRTHLWDIATGKERIPSPDFAQGVSALAFSADGSTLAAAGPRGTSGGMCMVVWDMARQRRRSKANVPIFWGFTADGRMLLGETPDGGLDFQLPNRFRDSPQQSKPGGVASRMRFYNQGQTLVRWKGDQLWVWDNSRSRWHGPFTLGLRRDPAHAIQDAISSVGVLPGGTVDVVVGRSGLGYGHLLFDALTGQKLSEHIIRTTKPSYTTNESLFSPDGRIWLPRSPELPPGLYETRTGKRILEAHFMTQGETLACFSPNDRILVTAGGENKSYLALWDTSTGKSIRRFEPLLGKIGALTFSPDGRQLATGFSNGDLLIWDLAALGAKTKKQ